MGFSPESLIVAIQDSVLRRTLKLHLCASRMDTLTDLQCPLWAQKEKAEAGCWVMATSECSNTSFYRWTNCRAQRSQDLPRITKYRVAWVGLETRNFFSRNS